MTALMSTTTTEAANVSWMAASACGLVMACDELVQAAGDRLPEQRRERDEDDEPQVERGDAGAQEAPAVVAAEGARPIARPGARGCRSSLEAQVRGRSRP